jgi:hypothetical protein
MTDDLNLVMTLVPLAYAKARIMMPNLAAENPTRLDLHEDVKTPVPAAS